MVSCGPLAGVSLFLSSFFLSLSLRENKGRAGGEGAVGGAATRRLPCSACPFLLLRLPGPGSAFIEPPGTAGGGGGPSRGRGRERGGACCARGRELAGGSLAARHSCTASAGARAAARSVRAPPPPASCFLLRCLPAAAASTIV